MTFDRNVPLALKSTQQWFASIITSPIDEDSKSNPITPRGNKLVDEAKKYIAPSPTMLPHERIELYNQQYWWRMLATMQEIFPLVTRLFGYRDFNQEIAIPYLVKHPPHTWSLNCIGEFLPKWIEKSYRAKDKKFVHDSAFIDLAYNRLFIIEAMLPLSASIESTSDDFSELTTRKLYLQPYVEVVALDYHLLQFRQELLQQSVEYWIDHDFPPLPKDKKYYFALYRNSHNNVSWKEISQGEYCLLSQFKRGSSIEEACHQLELNAEEIYSEAVAHIATWFQEWMVRKWLTLEMSTSL